MTYRVGVDIGGTFTDFCVLDEASHSLSTLKVLSTPDRPGSEVMTGIRQLEERFGIAPSRIVYFTHGTTVGVNTVIQRKGARLAMLVTENFADVLELARLKMPDMYDLFSRRPEPLVTKDRIFEIRERTRADGTLALPLDPASVEAAFRRIAALGCEGVVVAFLHAYRNPANERAAKALLNRLAPSLPVFCSSEVWPVIREYERTTTTVINGYVQPRVARYLGSLQEALREAGVPAQPLVTKSNGGIMSAELGKEACVEMILSGTASGVIGATHVARQCGIAHCMSLDIGGTSADVALIVDGQPQYGIGEMIGEFPIYVPTVSVTSIGAGGGSIAWVDPLGVLKVGPESAGSQPGPVCYDRGGTRPTITDAFAVCGLVGQGELGYNAVRLATGKAEGAIGELARNLGLGTRETAESIIRVAVSGMYMEVSKLVSRYGVDPRQFSLLAFGGAGPMMACFLARELGAGQIVVPPTPGVLSALGGLIAELKSDFIRTLYQELSPEALPAIRDGFAELAQRARSWLEDGQGYRGLSRLIYSADMRYKGQSFEIETPLEAEWVASGDIARIAGAFHDRHAAVYDHADREATVQIINLRLVIAGATPQPEMLPAPRGEGPPKPLREIEVWVDGALHRAPVYRRADLLAGQRFAGPAIVAQDDTTTCLLPGFTGEVDDWGNLLLRCAPPARAEG
jgi:N-methylhydantoinase A